MPVNILRNNNMEQRGPWQIQSSEVGYKDKRVEVRKDHVVDPTGKEYSLRIITIMDGASVLPMDDEENVYLAEEFHYGFGETLTEAVAGGIDEGEDPLEAAQRELEEEAGIVAKEWTDLGRSAAITSYMHHVQNLYLARGLTFTGQKLDSGEVIKVKKLPFKEVVQAVMESKILDAYTCVLILKAAKYLGKL